MGTKVPDALLQAIIACDDSRVDAIQNLFLVVGTFKSIHQIFSFPFNKF